jgi:hypothetical protein
MARKNQLGQAVNWTELFLKRRGRFTCLCWAKGSRVVELGFKYLDWKNSVTLLSASSSPSSYLSTATRRSWTELWSCTPYCEPLITTTLNSFSRWRCTLLDLQEVDLHLHGVRNLERGIGSSSTRTMSKSEWDRFFCSLRFRYRSLWEKKFLLASGGQEGWERRKWWRGRGGRRGEHDWRRTWTDEHENENS